MTTETLTRPAPVETVTPIRPSEAIRLGCLIAPVQAFGVLVREYDDGTPRAACAIGAALLAIGRPWVQGVPRHLFAASISKRCPAGATGYGTCDKATSCRIRVEHLNDAHHWSRERIADWLAEQGL